MSSILFRYLKNSNLVFLFAFLLGLVFGDYASSLKGYILPALVLIMSLSTTKITLSELIHVRKGPSSDNEFSHFLIKGF